MPKSLKNQKNVRTKKAKDQCVLPSIMTEKRSMQEQPVKNGHKNQGIVNSMK